ncbi:MAG: alanine racemase [Caproiciproducens sp.]|nr:alanine racemase [Caproiciproducens sp.]
MSVTIKDVAREAGVSPSTVSKIINHSPTISDATSQQVQNVMERLHYFPNAQARNFATQTTHNIVFLTKLEPHTAFTNPHMFEIMCGVREALAKREYNLSFVSVSQEEDAACVAERIIAQKSADGMVVHGSATTKDLTLFLVKSNFPHVIIGKPAFESQACWIDINNHLSGQIAAEHLLDCGYKRIAFIGGKPEDGISAQRLKGFIKVMEDKGVAVPANFIKDGDSTKLDGFLLANELLEGMCPPEAIICESDSIALGVVKSIGAHGYSIPDDIALICFDDFPLSRLIDPTPTVVDIDVHDMGFQAGSILIRKIKNPALQVQTYTTLPNLIVRESTKLI